VVLHEPHTAVSHPSPYSFTGSRMRVTEGGTPLVFCWSRSAVFSLSPGSSQKAAGIISSGLLHVRNECVKALGKFSLLRFPSPFCPAHFMLILKCGASRRAFGFLSPGLCVGRLGQCIRLAGVGGSPK
jgi:hypothetical protein